MLTLLSYTADTVLAHSFINGNDPLTEELIIKKGVDLTFEHLLIAEKVDICTEKLVK